jgi:hypothetical protein
VERGAQEILFVIIIHGFVMVNALENAKSIAKNNIKPFLTIEN